MRELIQKVFLSLVGVFLFFIFIKNEHYLNFLFIHFWIEMMVYILIIIFIVWVVKKLARQRIKFSIEVTASLLIILFFTYELFTPYFYTENYLKEVGFEKADILHQLSHTELTNQERHKLADEAVDKEMAYSYSILGKPNIDFFGIGEVIDFKREFNQYELIIESKHPELKKFQFTFAKEGLDFKIIGYGELN
ncbi:hypothetical protein V7112_15430 [Bacillus sp. JJ1566]|uniref:hypothetical protein n=1 Tax=Bacillus sp. JJ1566 TaxID=3122961 RepID=UPI002FFF5213